MFLEFGVYSISRVIVCSNFFVYRVLVFGFRVVVEKFVVRKEFNKVFTKVGVEIFVFVSMFCVVLFWFL